MGAPYKSTITYVHHTIRNGDFCQTHATIESHRADARHTVRNYDTRQTGATREGGFANARHAVRDRDARQISAIIEGIVANARHWFCVEVYFWDNKFSACEIADARNGIAFAVVV